MKGYIPLKDEDSPRFRGARDGLHGPVTVTIDGKPLALRLDLWNHSPDGFEWGYGGSGPAQLALAMLAAIAGDDETAVQFHQAFKRDVISHFTHAEWVYPVDAVREWLARRRAEGGVESHFRHPNA